MIKSMTGFGRCELADGERKFTIEMKGVNHRYLDVNIRMPKKLNFFETAIRNLLKQSVSRGKVDIFITYEDLSESQVSLKYNETLAGEYLKYFQQMQETFGLENDVRVSHLSRCPEVLTMEEQAVDEEELWNELKKALSGAISQFVETRSTEGENLKKDLPACEVYSWQELNGRLLGVLNVEKNMQFFLLVFIVLLLVLDAVVFFRSSKEEEKTITSKRDYLNEMTNELSELNKALGRRFKVVSFRWLNDSEI